MPESLLIKLQACEIFKNNVFTEHLWETASVNFTFLQRPKKPKTHKLWISVILFKGIFQRNKLIMILVSFKGIVRSFHQKNRKFFFCDCNLLGTKLYISVAILRKKWMETIKYWKCWCYPFCIPLKFNKSHQGYQRAL